MASKKPQLDENVGKPKPDFSKRRGTYGAFTTGDESAGVDKDDDGGVELELEFDEDEDDVEIELELELDKDGDRDGGVTQPKASIPLPPPEPAGFIEMDPTIRGEMPDSVAYRNYMRTVITDGAISEASLEVLEPAVKARIEFHEGVENSQQRNLALKEIKNKINEINDEVKSHENKITELTREAEHSGNSVSLLNSALESANTALDTYLKENNPSKLENDINKAKQDYDDAKSALGKAKGLRAEYDKLNSEIETTSNDSANLGMSERDEEVQAIIQGASKLTDISLPNIFDDNVPTMLIDKLEEKLKVARLTLKYIEKRNRRADELDAKVKAFPDKFERLRDVQTIATSDKDEELKVGEINEALSKVSTRLKVQSTNEVGRIKVIEKRFVDEQARNSQELSEITKQSTEPLIRDITRLNTSIRKLKSIRQEELESLSTKHKSHTEVEDRVSELKAQLAEKQSEEPVTHTTPNSDGVIDIDNQTTTTEIPLSERIAALKNTLSDSRSTIDNSFLAALSTEAANLEKYDSLFKNHRKVNAKIKELRSNVEQAEANLSDASRNHMVLDSECNQTKNQLREKIAELERRLEAYNAVYEVLQRQNNELQSPVDAAEELKETLQGATSQTVEALSEVFDKRVAEIKVGFETALKSVKPVPTPLAEIEAAVASALESERAKQIEAIQRRQKRTRKILLAALAAFGLTALTVFCIKNDSPQHEETSQEDITPEANQEDITSETNSVNNNNTEITGAEPKTNNVIQKIEPEPRKTGENKPVENIKPKKKETREDKVKQKPKSGNKANVPIKPKGNNAKESDEGTINHDI